MKMRIINKLTKTPIALSYLVSCNPGKEQLAFIDSVQAV
jgi:hypothetical protein